MMCKTKRLNCRGTSLLEVMVALGLFALAAATTGDYLVQQIRTTSQNNHYTVAYAVAERHLETVRAEPYSTMAATTEQVVKGSVVFDVSTTVEADTPEPNLKQVTVNVEWGEPGGRADVEVQTIYTAVRRF